MPHDCDLRFYAGGAEAFEQYTYYMYEKIFGEAFVASAGDSLAMMRQSFYDRYRDRSTALVRLTNAQNPFFASLESRMPEYGRITTPTLILAAEDDRVVSLCSSERFAGYSRRSRCGGDPRKSRVLLPRRGGEGAEGG